MESHSPALGEGDGAPRPDPDLMGWYGIPALAASYVTRPRLLSLLDGTEATPLVLVSAPAGTGKTSLVADWVGGVAEPERTAWVTFEPDEQAFWPSVVECLEQVGVSVSHREFPDDAVSVDRRALVSLASDVARLPAPVTLVVDGFELVSPEVAADVDFLLRHNGHRLRLVMVARIDPVLPLYRYRLDDTIAEVRMADLAFTDDEAMRLLTRCGVRISRDSVRLLNSRVEGWAVGLRFAAQILSLRDDPDRGVEEVVGDSGNIGEYLLGEVLDAQTPEVRQLLLSTSIPDTLQPGLLEELGGRSAARTLDLLTRSNAFIEPVPQRPGAFRYHPFFRDLLRAEFAYESPDLMAQVQRKAAAWFAHRGLLDESVSHYAAIDAWTDAAAEIVDALAVGRLLLDPRPNALVRTLEAIPHQVDDAAVHVVRAALALGSGDLECFAEQVELARTRSRSGDNRHDRAVSLAVAVLRAVRARQFDDADAVLTLVEVAEQALDAREHRAGTAHHPELRAMILASRGSALARKGRLGEASEAFEAAAKAAGGPGAESLLFDCLGQLAVLACFRGQVAHADRLATRAVTVADSAGIPDAARSPSTASAQAWLNAERNDLRQAVESVGVAERHGSAADDPVTRTLLTVAKARVRVAQGDVPGALSGVEEASAEMGDRDGWLRDRLSVEKAYLRVRNGDAAAALLEVEDISADGDAEAALVVAQARLQQGDDEATADSLAAALAKDAPLTTQIEGWLVEAARQLNNGSTAHGRAALSKSLRLAGHESVRRPFREAHAAVRELLARDAQLQAQNSWLIGEPGRPGAHGRLLPNAATGQPVSEEQGWTPVVESLTAKELEVLGLLAELLTTEEIASAMFVSVNTIRTHVRSILRKLGVSRRNAAVRRARELELLPVS